VKLAGLCAALVVLLSSSRLLDAHPLHTSLAELSYDPAAKEIRLSVRVFIDDFTKASVAYARTKAAAARQPANAVSTESPILSYARYAFVVADRAGKRLSLASCGGKRVGDLMWLCFHSSAPSGPAGFQIADRILFDMYSDQINIVQAAYGGQKANVLFTRGDGFKRLPRSETPKRHKRFDAAVP
jgi:hypothetical protein